MSILRKYLAEIIPSSTAAWLIFVVQLLLVATLITLPYADLFISGPFGWQLHLPRVTQGGIEALIFLALCLAINLSNRRPLLRGISLLLVGLIYLRLHYIDVQLFTALLYMEALVAIGAFVLSRWRKDIAQMEFSLLAFLCGITIGTLLIAFLSLMGLAIPVISYSVIVVFGLVTAVWKRTYPITFLITQQSLGQSLGQRLVYSCLYVTVLVMSAKIQMISDFDSTWYGLRSQYVLEQGGSIFANLGLAHFVYYYPKLYEVLILPLCGFGDNGFPAAFNIFVYIIILATVYQGMLIFNASRNFASLAMLVIGWIPVVVSSALLVKPDLLTAAILLIAFIYSVRAVSELNLADGVVTASALCIALAGKLVSIPFGGLLAIWFATAVSYRIVGTWFRNRSLAILDMHIKHGIYLLPLGIATLLVISYRTYYLTGLPIIMPEFVVHWLSYFGFRPHFPYQPVFVNDTWHFRFADLMNWVHLIFTPSGLPHIVMLWTGNLYILTTLIALMTIRKWFSNTPYRIAFLFSSAIFVFALMIIAFYGTLPGGDGNYYLFPVIAFTAITTASYEYLQPLVRKMAVTLLTVLIAFHVFVWFATTPMWRSGTNAFSLDLSHTVYTSNYATDAILKSNGLMAIKQALQAADKQGHCTALADGPPAILYALPCGVEAMRAIKAIASDYVRNSDAISKYLVKAHFDFIIITKSGADTPLSKIFAVYSKLPGVVEVDDVLYKMLDLRAVKVPLPVLPHTNVGKTAGVSSIALASNVIFDRARINKTAEIPDPWRQSVSLADKILSQYLDNYGLVIRNGASIDFPLGIITACPATLSFRLGLLPIDQVLHRQTKGLRIEIVDRNDDKILESVTYDVPENGFKQEKWIVSQCRNQENLVLRLYAIPVIADKPASIVLAGPEISR